MIVEEEEGILWGGVDVTERGEAAKAEATVELKGK